MKLQGWFFLMIVCAAFGWGSNALAQESADPGQAIEINEQGEPILPAETPVPASEHQTSSGTMALLRKMEEAHKDVKTIHARFHQVTVDETFTDTIETDGELCTDKPDRFRSDYADPDKVITLILKDALYLYVPKNEQVDYWTFASPEEHDQQLHQLLLGFGFRAGDLAKMYAIHSSEDEKAVQAELAKERETLVKEKLNPTSLALVTIAPRPAIKETCPFVQLKVYVDKKRFLPEKIWFKDQNGADKTLFMKHIEFNSKLPEDLFDKKKLFPVSEDRYFNKRNTQ